MPDLFLVAELEQISSQLQTLFAKTDALNEKVEQLLSRRVFLVCEDCQGDGKVSDSFGESPCYHCHGKGMVPS